MKLSMFSLLSNFSLMLLHDSKHLVIKPNWEYLFIRHIGYKSHMGTIFVFQVFFLHASVGAMVPICSYSYIQDKNWSTGRERSERERRKE